jgi:hypothetical protein
MLRSSAFAAVLLLAISSVPTSHGETIVFSDKEFFAADWDLTIFWTLGYGGEVNARRCARMDRSSSRGSSPRRIPDRKSVV